MEDLYIIAGLGNPGNKYDNTRHNVGFDTVDFLASKHNIKMTKLKHKALYGEGNIDGAKVILAKPQTFMNLSGESVRDMIEWYKIPIGNIIIIYDDVDLDLGRIRVRPKGSAGTHNGMRSILYQIQSEDFPRVRIGIGRPPQGWDMADFVLGRFNAQERKLVNDSILRAGDAVSDIINNGAQNAMSRYNG